MRDKFDNLIRIYVDANYRLRLDRRVQRDLLMVGDKIKIENVFKNIVEKSYSETGFSQKSEADLLVYN
jgi:uridine kinase